MRIHINENQYARLLSESSNDRYGRCGFEMLVGIPGCGKSMYLGEAKTPPPLHWFVGNVYDGKYDMNIYEKMRMRDSSRHLAKYVNWFPLSDEDKQSLYDCMVTRYKYLLTCIANTAQVGKSIMGGMFDDDIANKDYSWFEQAAESEPIDKEFIKQYIEKRIEIGKRRKLFRGLPGRISWVTGFGPLTRLVLSPMGILKGRR